jgi:nucleotide-binding universal stress UspA family protein
MRFCKEVDMMEAQYQKLILAVDDSLHSNAAIELVAGLDWPAGTAVHVLAVAPEVWSPYGLGAEEARVVRDTVARIRRRNQTAAQQVAARVAERLRHVWADDHRAELAIAPEIQEGRAAEVILERAAALPADLIAIGARGLSAPSAFRLGATAHKVAAHAGCAVLVAKPPADVPLSSVVLAVDGSPEAQRAVEWVCALALPRGAEVAVVGIAEVVGDFPADSGGEREYARDADLALIQRALLHTAETQVWAALDRLHISGAQVNPIIRTGQPAAEIVRIAQEQDADLLVIGARGQTRAEPFPLGGVAEKLVRFAPCSVLVAR